MTNTTSAPATPMDFEGWGCLIDAGLDLKKAVDLFVQGEYSFGRKATSGVYDYGLIKHLSFGENVSGRTDELIVNDVHLDLIVEMLNKLDQKKAYWLTVLSEKEPHSFYAKGYTLRSKEFLMTLDMDGQCFESDPKVIKRVNRWEDAQRINDFFSKNVIDLEKFHEPNLHFYIGEENGQPVSYGSFALLDTTVFINNVFTTKEHRGKGIERKLCQRMLFDAKKGGAFRSILVSSRMGHPLYLKLGYRDISRMWVLEKTSGYM